MTPKEKAKELVEKFKEQLKTATPHLNRPHYQAKKCALISVDEIINRSEDDFHEDSMIVIKSDFWQKVKEKIKKL